MQLPPQRDVHKFMHHEPLFFLLLMLVLRSGCHRYKTTKTSQLFHEAIHHEPFFFAPAPPAADAAAVRVPSLGGTKTTSKRATRSVGGKISAELLTTIVLLLQPHLKFTVSHDKSYQSIPVGRQNTYDKKPPEFTFFLVIFIIFFGAFRV